MVGSVPILPPAPRFASEREYRASLSDAEFWSAYIQRILSQHGYPAADLDTGAFGTSPTFLAGAVVVKLFGATDPWHLDYATELAVHELLLDHPDIPAPQLLTRGQLYDDPNSWPYLVLQRLPGRPWHDVSLPHDQQRQLSRQLGEVIRRVHDIQLPVQPRPGRLGRDWLADHGIECAERHRAWGTLPAHLLSQVESFIEPMEAPPHLVHADLAIDHIFVADDHTARLGGIIDWGGAEATDPHYELPILAFDGFRGDKELLRSFLDGYSWAFEADFPYRAMNAALQHESDVFDNLLAVRAGFALDQFTTLDELAVACWNLDD